MFEGKVFGQSSVVQVKNLLLKWSVRPRLGAFQVKNVVHTALITVIKRCASY